MNALKKNNKPSEILVLPKLILLVAALTLAGCTITPKLATQEEVRERVKSDTDRMYVNQSPISAPVSLEEAIARTLKYNLDYRLKKMESALALGLTDYASYDTLPKLLASAGYRTRSNQSGGTSIGIVDGVQSLRPSTSEERSHALAGAEFSWNLLDFGVSYYRARQQSDQFLIAEERRRKVVQNMVQDVRAAYWRALGAQRLSVQTKDKNQVEVDASNGMPVTFTLSRETRDSLENARWSIVLADGKGHVKGETRHASMLPANARDTAYEATLVAALTSKLPQLKTWLGEIAREVAQ